MTSLKKYRLLNGYTQKELAKKLGIAASTLFNWETNAYVPNVYDALKIADALGEDVRTLFPLEGQE